MEAEDTVMTYDEVRTYWLKRGVQGPDIDDTKEAQAEISFKAGIREVVRWVNRKLIVTFPLDTTEIYHLKMVLGSYEWQAKLKEWGIARL